MKKPVQNAPVGISTNVEVPFDRHSARSKLESQNLIVIPREAKWNRRIYWRTDDWFCNSGQKSPQCRMTRWMALSEFKALRFCQVHQLPKIFRFSYERSLLTPSFWAKRSEVVESIGGPMMDSATPDKDVLRAEWQDGWLTMNLRTLSFMRLINFPKNPDFPSNALCSPRILSAAKSQKLIVILREAKWSRRI